MMEETANPTNPSATLAPEMPTTQTVGDAKANTTTSIKLLIKASNQQHDDQIIESDLMWTVFRLKTQLSLVYPSKPPVSEQKLIYSGQLLNDCAQLKDIIRSYKDVYTQNHILHLVYTPKNQPLQRKMTPISNTDGLRQRQNVVTTPSTSTSNTTSTTSDRTSQHSNRQQLSSSNYGYSAPVGVPRAPTTNNLSGFSATNNSSSSPFTGGFDMQSFAIQQTAMYNWMWQAYGQYMQQFQNAAAQMSTANSANNTTHSLTYPYNPVIAFPSLTTASFFAQPYLNQRNQMPLSDTRTSVQQNEPLQEQQQQQQQEQQQEAADAAAAPAQPRFLNIVQEEQENRDWLDSFFSIMRLALFLTILYFNSSAIRCLMVFIIAGGIYLYHIGFFRSRQERNNNDINRNNNTAAPVAADAAQPDGQQPNHVNNDINPAQNEQVNDTGVANNAAGTTDVSSAQDATAAAAAAEDNSSVISFIRSFIVSFFTSLLPETPAAL